MRVSTRIVLLVGIITASVAVFLIWIHISAPKQFEPRVVVGAIAEDSEIITTDAGALFAYVAAYGPRQTVAFLDVLEESREESCHNAAHEVGNFAYDLYGADAFGFCGSECQSGCYHGVMEEYFLQNGMQDIGEQAKELCGKSLNAFFQHQCIHGIGHGLMALMGYRLPEALIVCDQLNALKERESCYTGVFMENIVAGLAETDRHASYYTSKDPLFPCNAVAEQYRWSCWFLQTSRIRELIGDDFLRIADICSGLSKMHQEPCFQSLGRDVGSVYRDNPEKAALVCAGMPGSDAQSWCTSYAALGGFWDESGTAYALTVCAKAVEAAKAVCYLAIGEQAGYLFDTRKEHRAFCAAAEQPYQKECLRVATWFNRR